MVAISSTKKNGIWFSVALNQKGKLLACAFSDRNKNEAERSVSKSLPRKVGLPIRANGEGNRSFLILTNFYNGKGKRANLRSFDLSSVSKFRLEVYRTLCKIPLGKVTTYGAIAQNLGGRKFARAVGSAVATNPLPLLVPCHRVVPSSLKVGNYGMCGRNPSTGGYMKRMLLEREGVRFQGDEVSKQSLWTPT